MLLSSTTILRLERLCRIIDGDVSSVDVGPIGANLVVVVVVVVVVVDVVVVVPVPLAPPTLDDCRSRPTTRSSRDNEFLTAADKAVSDIRLVVSTSPLR